MNIRHLTTQTKLLLIFAHIIFGVFVFYIPEFMTVQLALVSGAALFYVFSTRNATELAPYFVMYLLGAEVLSRMSGGVILYEFAKYISVLIFALSFVLERRRNKLCIPIIIYFILMLPAVFVTLDYESFTLFRHYISFSLSGPLALAVSAIYFYKRPVSMQDVSGYAFVFILPLVSMSTYVILFMPSFQTAQFGTYSNFEFSGGFGPNQVATAFGAAVLFILLPILLKRKIITKSIDLGLLAFFLGLAYITFSRGGVVTSILASIVGVASVQIKPKMTAQNIRWFFTGLVFCLLFFQVWLVVNMASKGALADRYAEIIEKDTRNDTMPSFTGRRAMIEVDLEIFKEHFWEGCGVGRIKGLHKEKLGKASTAHTEHSRVLAEHGVLGVVILIIFFTLPLVAILQRQDMSSRLFVVTLVMFVMLTMVHSATRLAVPMVFYGLSLSFLQPRELFSYRANS
jgi:hypothetical protein